MTNNLQNFNILDLIRCKHDMITTAGEEENQIYFVIPASPAKGILYVTQNNLHFISGYIRVGGRNNGSYRYTYLEMIDTVFGREDKTIEVCSGMTGHTPQSSSKNLYLQNSSSYILVMDQYFIL